jgi:hypothetical protein
MAASSLTTVLGWQAVFFMQPENKNEKIIPLTNVLTMFLILI